MQGIKYQSREILLPSNPTVFYSIRYQNEITMDGELRSVNPLSGADYWSSTNDIINAKETGDKLVVVDSGCMLGVKTGNHLDRTWPSLSTSYPKVKTNSDYTFCLEKEGAVVINMNTGEYESVDYNNGQVLSDLSYDELTLSNDGVVTFKTRGNTIDDVVHKTFNLVNKMSDSFTITTEDGRKVHDLIPIN